MSWMQKLYETYEVCVQQPDFVNPPQEEGKKEVHGLMPVSHTSQLAHIEVTLDDKGNFLRAELLPPKTQIIIPATEDSAARSSNIAPHPLMDNLSYCACDYKLKSPIKEVQEIESVSDTKRKEKKESPKDRYVEYMKQLKEWCTSSCAHPQAKLVRSYLERGSLLEDLVLCGIVKVDERGKLVTDIPKSSKNTLLHLLSKDPKSKMRDQGKALIRWIVLNHGDIEPRTWKNKSLQEAWSAYDASQMQQKAVCMVSGEKIPITTKHPRNIRRPGDGAKLISSNDNEGFTFRGRFIKSEQACTVGYEISHKAHNALRWLITRQGYQNGDQVVLAWAVKGVDVPNPGDWQPHEDLDFGSDDEDDAVLQVFPEKYAGVHRDVGQAHARCLAKALHGYKKNLEPSDCIAILALDAASPGRLSVTFYREQLFEIYLEKLKQWQEDMAWILPIKIQATQENKTRIIFTLCAPLPETITRIAYGKYVNNKIVVDDKLLKATIERLLPCIVDGSAVPRDLVESCVRRACNRVGFKEDRLLDWKEALSVACAIYKCYYARHPKKNKRRIYSMALDRNRSSRDYLYGRLLAVAEYAERSVLDKAGEKRPTNAERLMQRFADSPCSTWLILEKQLAPYMQRLQGYEKSPYVKIKKELQEICDMCETVEDFISSRKLDGEFLLGYHCQLSDLYKKKEKDTATHEGEKE